MTNINRKKGKTGIIGWLILGAMAVFYFLGDEQPSKQSVGSQSQQPPVARPSVPTSESSYALAPNRNTWPEVKGSATAFTDPVAMQASNYYLVLDGSGSMADKKCSGSSSKHQVAIDAVKTFARALPNAANFGLAVFTNSQLRELIPLGPKQQGNLEVLSTIVPSGATPLYSALKFAYQKLSVQGQRQQGYGEYHLVMVTDGLASKGQDPSPMLRTLFAQSPVVLHTIGFCIGKHHSLNQPGSSFYQQANDPDSLNKGLGSVLAESPEFNITHFE